MSLIDEIRAELKKTPRLPPPLELCDCCFERKPDLVAHYAEICLPQTYGKPKRVLINFRLCQECQRETIVPNIGQDILTSAKIGECGG